ncbi:hypothetical protein [Paraliomyxa miuraensis]|uniref:hypothetical protein n=1 Tax=Paraliomyxa miuraensis TaxID=376150 RepID=UPI002258AAC7|nr:hypothetical protein [Paraliomyxa miuraensis]MCX4247683.1 hypothetical protein [Paraliomyxa miuraensis]
MRTLRTFSYPSVLGLGLLLASCGKEPVQTTTPDQGTAQAGGQTSTPAQRPLAHFRTADGMIGFTLDRSGTPIKLQVDGEQDVFELTQQERRNDRGELLDYVLLDPTATPRVSIGKHGGITYLRGKDELPATADDTAVAPLGPPTVAGPPVAPPEPLPAWAEVAARLEGISVRGRFPEFEAKDSADLAKVRAAIAKAEASMFVHYVEPGEDGWVARAETVPSSFSGMAYGGGDFATDDDEAKRYKALVKHGARIIGVSSPERDLGNHILVRRSDDRDELADGTPGLVWEVDGSTVVFVTLDGGRYRLDVNQPAKLVVPGTGPEASWPAPLQDTYADITVISSLVKAGAHPQSTVDELEAIDAEWNACVAKAWKPTRIKRDVNHPAQAVKIHKGCRKAMQKLEAALVRFIDARSKERKALYDEAVARVRTVGATK